MKKQISIRQLILGWGFFYTVLLIVLITAAILYLERAASESLIRRELMTAQREVNENLKFKKDGTVSLSKDYSNVSKGYSFAFYSLDKKFLFGEEPDSFQAKDYLKKDGENKRCSDPSKIRIIRINGEKYAFRFRSIYERRGEQRIERGYLCSFLNIREMENHYRDISYSVMAAVIVVAFCMMCLLIVMTKHLERTLSRISENALQIGLNMDLSRRLETDMNILELQSLADAHNRLLHEVEKTIIKQQAFNRDVTHELRTPIAVIGAQCQLMKDDYKTDEVLCERIGIIDRQNQRMRQLVNRLLALSHLENDKDHSKEEDIRLDEVITFLCEDMEETYDISGLFSTTLFHTVIRADMDLIVTLFGNLISNAVKYGEGKPVEISLRKKEKTIEARIRDHGIGITPEEQDRIFDTFYRADSSRSEDGFGLGLTMARRIARSYGGDITVESEPGNGSVFTVTLNC